MFVENLCNHWIDPTTHINRKFMQIAIQIIQTNEFNNSNNAIFLIKWVYLNFNSKNYRLQSMNKQSEQLNDIIK